MNKPPNILTPKCTLIIIYLENRKYLKTIKNYDIYTTLENQNYWLNIQWMTKFNPNFEEDFTLLLNELDLEDEKKNKITKIVFFFFFF